MLLIPQLLEQPSLLAYFIGADNYAWLQFRGGERRLLAKPLRYFETRLPTFIRVHKTALINPACIAHIIPPPRPKMAGSVVLTDGTKLPVSRRRWRQVAQLLERTDEKPVGAADTSCIETNQYGVIPSQIHGIMGGDMVLLTEQCLRELQVPYVLRSSNIGSELASALLLNSCSQWPKLILIDSRINRADSLLTLQALKSNPRLRTIPVIYLVSPGDYTMNAYRVDANSVIVVPNDLRSLVQILNQVLEYWLKIVQLIDQTVNS